MDPSSATQLLSDLRHFPLPSAKSCPPRVRQHTSRTLDRMKRLVSAIASIGPLRSLWISGQDGGERGCPSLCSTAEEAVQTLGYCVVSCVEEVSHSPDALVSRTCYHSSPTCWYSSDFSSVARESAHVWSSSGWSRPSISFSLTSSPQRCCLLMMPNDKSNKQVTKKRDCESEDKLLLVGKLTWSSGRPMVIILFWAHMKCRFFLGGVCFQNRR